MAKQLSYRDAVRLLGGNDNKLVAALDNVAGGAILASSVPLPAILAWFDARDEFVKLSRRLISGLRERWSGLSRYSRTQRLEAAHAVIVVTAYFEALAEADLPFRFQDLELTKEEQSTLASRSAATVVAKDTVSMLMELDLTPTPDRPYEEHVGILRDYFGALSGTVEQFVTGLAIWDQLGETTREAARAVLVGVPSRACAVYEELYRRLATDFPEVAFWTSRWDHQATRAQIREARTALAGLGDLLAAISTGRRPDEWRASLERACNAALERPIAESGDIPAGLQLPSLGAAYVTPSFRTARLFAGIRASDEAWWARIEIRDGLQEFLIGYLTSPEAVSTPLLVLGQPGSGKSVLMKVLASRLPAADFLPVRVVLRDVPAEADLQDQIEHAIRDATGERLDWPDLARSAGDALPVVMLDGFDELVQATGVSQSDYLTRVANLQRREADQGRPMVVLVTSRTSVADRARAPEDTVAIRLEPFDESRIAAWLEVWNRTNARYFAAGGAEPLTIAAVRSHLELAEQPLLLLMLALYDADGNALQRGSGRLRRDELYQRLLLSFARREVIKHRPSLSDADLDRAAEEELRRLSVVAFAMFNRNSQWVTESDLAVDLHAIFGPSPAVPTQQLRAPLDLAEITLGRFFFIHRARASRDDTRLETYEFLHATFAEYLVARLVWLVLRSMANREAAETLPVANAPVDDDFLHALLSFSPLVVRAPTVEFLAGMASGAAASDRRVLGELVLRLFRTVHQPRPPRKLEDYQPRFLPVPARHAAYSANLLVLAVCLLGRVRASELYGGRPGNVVDHWNAETLLWRSQLDAEGWVALFQTFALDRTDNGTARDVELTIDDGSFVPPPIDLAWTFDIKREAESRISSLFVRLGDFHMREAFFQCDVGDDFVGNALAPLTSVMEGYSSFTMFDSTTPWCTTGVRQVIEFLSFPFRNLTKEERIFTYERLGQLTKSGYRNSFSGALARLLMDAVLTDDEVPPRVGASVMNAMFELGWLDGDLREQFRAMREFPARS